jgi:hypothetical protein
MSKTQKKMNIEIMHPFDKANVSDTEGTIIKTPQTDRCMSFKQEKRGGIDAKNVNSKTYLNGHQTVM